MSLLNIYFLHIAGYLSGAFNVFCSIVVFVATVTVGIREFSMAGFIIFVMQTLAIFVAGSYYFLMCCIFTAQAVTH